MLFSTSNLALQKFILGLAIFDSKITRLILKYLNTKVSKYYGQDRRPNYGKLYFTDCHFIASGDLNGKWENCYNCDKKFRRFGLQQLNCEATNILEKLS